MKPSRPIPPTITPWIDSFLGSRTPHIHCAHKFWDEHLREGDVTIDATCGNGHDALFLAQKTLGGSLENPLGKLFCIDVQKSAIESTRQRLSSALNEKQLGQVSYFLQSHTSFPKECYKEKVRLIVYNLGYLPHGDHTITTQRESSLESFGRGVELLAPGGLLSITAYPGHEEGEAEYRAITEWMPQLSAKEYAVCHYQWPSRAHSPALFLLKKLMK